jgi:3-deoxy-D-manno-octulosonic-acid transferase
LGETIAIKPIIDNIGINNVNLTSITNTGLSEAKKISSSSSYLPFEIFFPFFITKQKALIVMEAELWFMLFFIAKRLGVKTVLINARISNRSVESYSRFRWFYRFIFENIDKVFAQTNIDKERLEFLGAKSVEVIGNIKVCKLSTTTKEYSKPKNIEVITAGSTHKGEEKLILDSITNLNGRKLIIVPRHPERFDEVNTLLEQFSKERGYSYSRFSQTKDLTAQIVLVDMLGELVNIYAISDVVILAGSFEKIGGHNPVEPASFNCKIISGKEIFNQKALYESVSNIYQVEKDKLKDILEDSKSLKRSEVTSIGTIEPIVEYLNGLE